MNYRDYLCKSVPLKFVGNMPKGYVNNVQYWGNISRQDLYAKLPDGTPKMQTMDIDFGDVCSLACPHCFRRDTRVDSVIKPITNEQIIDYIRQAKDLGLQSVKILGRGEPFQNPDFLYFLRQMTDMGIGVGIFTKGTVLGDDKMAMQYNEKYGIKTARDLISAIKELKTAIYLNFMSFDDGISSKMVGNIPLYNERRNTALQNLANVGFNDFVAEVPTRLALICAPYTPETVNEVFDIYKFGHERNMYVVACPTTLSGKGIDTYEKQKNGHYGRFIKKAEYVYADIYTYAIKNNIVSWTDFLTDGPHLYPGAHPCNQTAAGFYLQLSGQVFTCPGRMDDETIVAKDIRDYPDLRTVWQDSVPYKRAMNGKKFNLGCMARDGRSLPNDFYKRITDLTLKQLAR